MILQQIKGKEQALGSEILNLKFSIWMEISGLKPEWVTHATLDISDGSIF